MSGEDTDQDKTEQPTPFKLSRAREKGTVARGTDLGFLTGLTALLGFVWVAAPRFGSDLAIAVQRSLAEAAKLADGPAAIYVAASQLFAAAIGPLAFFAVLVFVVVALFEIVQTGPVFSVETLRPDFTRLNPAKGFKRLFSVRLLIETAKNILKLLVYTALGYLLITAAFRAGAGSILDARGLIGAMAASGTKLLAAFALGALFFAVLDQMIVRRDFFKRMRMSRREIRRESRDREGDPRLKQKRKQLHAEYTKNSRSIRGLKGADVMITNPEHIAIALRYDRKTMEAPKIVSIGTNAFAQRLKRLAFIHGVPVVQDRTLARELFRGAQLDKPIPGHCYRPVADIYNALRRRGAAEAGQAHV